jgi:hypothetical protein
MTWLSASPDSDRFTVDDDEGLRQLCVRHLREQSFECLLCFFDGRGPHPESNDACVGSDWEGPLVGEIFIECDNHGLSGLRPGEDFLIGSPRQFDIRGMVDGPLWTLGMQPLRYGTGDILIE